MRRPRRRSCPVQSLGEIWPTCPLIGDRNERCTILAYLWILHWLLRAVCKAPSSGPKHGVRRVTDATGAPSNALTIGRNVPWQAEIEVPRRSAVLPARLLQPGDLGPSIAWSSEAPGVSAAECGGPSANRAVRILFHIAEFEKCWISETSRAFPQVETARGLEANQRHSTSKVFRLCCVKGESTK